MDAVDQAPIVTFIIFISHSMCIEPASIDEGPVPFLELGLQPLNFLIACHGTTIASYRIMIIEITAAQHEQLRVFSPPIYFGRLRSINPESLPERWFISLDTAEMDDFLKSCLFDPALHDSRPKLFYAGP